LKAQFEAEYNGCNLIEFLSYFSQPLPLRDHQLYHQTDEDHIEGQFVHMVSWLLQRHLIVQVGNNIGYSVAMVSYSYTFIYSSFHNLVKETIHHIQMMKIFSYSTSETKLNVFILVNISLG